MRSRSPVLGSVSRVASLLVVLAAGLGACEGCRSSGRPETPAVADPGPPTLRLYIVSNLAGALEPCGCTKAQLGGMDHLAAFVNAERAKSPASVLVAAGPLFFMDAELKPDRAEQDKAKAQAIAKALASLGFAAFAPAKNDWAAGPDGLASYAKASGGVALIANPQKPDSGAPPIEGASRWVVRNFGPIKLGLVGVGPGGGATDAVKEAALAMRKEGANVLVALASVGRGEAKRIADRVPELTAIVVGAESASGEGNSPAPPAERIEKVIVAESANHLQSVAVLDLYLKDGPDFADATGLARAQRREELTRRIDDLRVKIAAWEKEGRVARADLDARRDDLLRIQKERDALDVQPPPEKGSFFRYAVREMTTSLGSDPAARGEMLSYYKSVNDRNRELFKDRAPLPLEKDQAGYVGVEACTACHAPARKFWDGTAHARAYKTLSAEFKELNLDCVSCHVTGYERPGGSTVTHVDKLRDVQCEVCHGPGSKHVAQPNDRTLVTRTPRMDVCTSCHHPPHVEQFDPAAKIKEIVGPGHGQPLAPK